jgi:hypothetical protein
MQTMFQVEQLEAMAGAAALEIQKEIQQNPQCQSHHKLRKKSLYWL